MSLMALNHVAAVQETNFVCATDGRILENDFDVFSAYGSHNSAGVVLLVGRSIDADVDVLEGDGGRLVVADVAGKSFKLRFMRLISLRRGFLFSSGGAVPGRFEAASLNGRFKCDP